MPRKVPAGTLSGVFSRKWCYIFWKTHTENPTGNILRYPCYKGLKKGLKKIKKISKKVLTKKP